MVCSDVNLATQNGEYRFTAMFQTGLERGGKWNTQLPLAVRLAIVCRFESCRSDYNWNV